MKLKAAYFFSNLRYNNLRQLILTWWAWTGSHDLMKREYQNCTWWVCVFILSVRIVLMCAACCDNALLDGRTHCAACRCMHCLRWSRCVAGSQCAVCLCRLQPQGLCRLAAICMDSPSHRRVLSTSEETGHDAVLTHSDTVHHLKPKRAVLLTVEQGNKLT